MLNFLTEMFVCQALFLGLYQLFKSEPFFKINRLYLLTSLLLSMTLPLIAFANVLPYQLSQTYVEWLQPLQIGGGDIESTPSFSETQIQATKGLPWNTYYIIYGIGLTIYLVWFLFRNRQLFKYLNLNSFEEYKNKPVVRISKTAIAFSFLDRIYIGENIPETQRQVILEHEYQHLQKRHSWDMLLVELLQLLLWFNPLIYIYKLQIRQLHEFEVDHSVTAQFPISNYINTLLNQSFGSQNVSFIHTFSNTSQLKNRINMLRHTKKTTLRTLKYLLIIPVLALATLWSCTQDENFEEKLTEEETKDEILTFINTVVDQDPSIFKQLKQKPSLEEIFKEYDLKIKNSYSDIEERKVGFVLTMVTIMTKDDESYHKQILNEINSSEALKIAFEKAQKPVEDAKNYKVESSFEGPVTDDTEVPFALLDNPAHPAECSELSGDELKKCVSQTIANHVNSHFDTSKFKDLGSGKYRVSVQFKIDKSGEITNVRARGSSVEMENEALRVIETLPSFIPGEVDGQKVGVLYGLPINFVIN
jgi:hypothetical protein